jgi:hypothetical protein
MGRVYMLDGAYICSQAWNMGILILSCSISDGVGLTGASNQEAAFLKETQVWCTCTSQM